MSRNIIGSSSNILSSSSNVMGGSRSPSTAEMRDACKRFITQGPKDWQEKHRKEDTDPTTHPSNKYIIINVSGSIFKTKSETLSRFPDTLLGSLSDRLKYYDERTGELFFDRHSPSFPSILYYYQSNGQIHKPTAVSMSLFREELTFFKIKTDDWLEEQSRNKWSYVSGENPVDPINNNPAYQYHMNRPISRNGSGYLNKLNSMQRRETITVVDSNSLPHSRIDTPISSTGAAAVPTNHRASVTSAPSFKDGIVTSGTGSYSPIPQHEKHRKRTLRSKIYDILDHPETSKAAKIFSWSSMGLIIFSVGTFIAETLPVYRADLQSKLWWETSTGIIFFSLETTCIAFFSLELIGRFASCPNKSKFAKNKLNIIDLISIVPYYMELIVPKNLDSIGSLFVLRILRLFRVLRIFKLSRHSKNMIAFGMALHASLAELLMLGLFLLIDVIIFASAVYYAEMDTESTKFDCIPNACWWAVVTVTTLGYGDMYPETAVGKVLGTLCVISGILVIAFQMPIMVAKFTWTFMQNTAETPNIMEEEYYEGNFDEIEEQNQPKTGENAC